MKVTMMVWNDDPNDKHQVILDYNHETKTVSIGNLSFILDDFLISMESHDIQLL